MCKTLEISGSTCRCKDKGCIGDQSDSSTPTRHTILQETAPSTYGRCQCNKKFQF